MRITESYLKALIESKVKKILKEGSDDLEDVASDVIAADPELAGVKLTPVAPVPEPVAEPELQLTPDIKLKVMEFIDKHPELSYVEMKKALGEEFLSTTGEPVGGAVLKYLKDQKDFINKTAAETLATKTAKKIGDAATAAINKDYSKTTTTPEDRKNLLIIQKNLEFMGFLNPNRERKDLYTKEFDDAVKKFKQNLKDDLDGTNFYLKTMAADLLPKSKASNFSDHLKKLAPITSEYIRGFKKAMDIDNAKRGVTPSTTEKSKSIPIAGAASQTSANESYIRQVIQEETIKELIQQELRKIK